MKRTMEEIKLETMKRGLKIISTNELIYSGILFALEDVVKCLNELKHN